MKGTRFGSTEIFLAVVWSSLEVVNIVVETLVVLLFEVRMLLIVGHWSKVRMFRLRQSMRESSSDVHGQKKYVQFLLDLIVLVIIVALRLIRWWSRRGRRR